MVVFVLILMLVLMGVGNNLLDLSFFHTMFLKRPLSHPVLKGHVL